MMNETNELEASLIKEETKDDLNNFDTILTKLLEKIDIPSIKNALQDRIIINKITNDGVYIITISKVAQLIFNNKDHRQYIESKMSETIGKPVAIHLTFENKESYFARKLWLEN